MSELEMRERRAKRYRRKLHRRKIVMYQRAVLLSGVLTVTALVAGKWLHE